ncbi:hypothetical protein HPB50_029593 [Hyalomma asiaticum]|nr:hypothetical protein HPB50_029593 [Hyalomma asiaticum]
MTLEHHYSSSSSSRLKRKRQRCPSTTSSTTFILAEDVSSPENASRRTLLAGHKELCELKDESRRKPQCRHDGPCLLDSSAPPRQAPRYIKQLAAKSFKQISSLSTLQEDDRSSSDGDEQVELCLCSTPCAEKADEDPTDKPLRPQKRRRLGSLARRTTGLDTDLPRRLTRCFMD